MIRFFMTSMNIIILVFVFHCSYPHVTRDRSSAQVRDRRSKKSQITSRNPVIYGKASFYGPKFHGRKTASGEVFNQYDLTAAHKTLPFGTICRVTNLDNGKSVIVKINDRGPFIQGRILDLSYKAAQVVDGIISGVIDVKIEILKYGKE